MLSPMMKHYLSIKEKNPDTILFYRLGDFYEMFFEDAELVSRELDLTLTGKDCGLEERAPMCGIPYHAAEGYISRLISKGYKVAICEQLSDPKASKGLVERDIVQIVTPGTVIDSESLDSFKNNYLVAVCKGAKGYGLCYSDISTGKIEAMEIFGKNALSELDSVLSRVHPVEALCNLAFAEQKDLLLCVKSGLSAAFEVNDPLFDYSKSKDLALEQFKVNNLSALGIDGRKELLMAVGAVLKYFEDTQKRLFGNIKKLSIVESDRFVYLDSAARKNLELVESKSQGQKKGSLLWLLDRSKTSMGARRLRNVVEEPITDEEEITRRLDGVEELKNDHILRESLCEQITSFTDIERKCSKIAAGTIMPKECLALAESLEKLTEIKRLLLGCKSQILHSAGEKICTLSDLAKVITQAIDKNAPATLSAGGYILSSYNDELKRLRNAGEYGKQWLAEFEQDEREITGIKNLKTGYNRVFGYYIEVTKSWLDKVPSKYIRKQTTINSERYITPELKEMEYKILGSKEEAIELEAKLYAEIKKYLLSYLSELEADADAISTLDFIASFALVAAENNYCRPKVSSSIKHIKIEEGRHPVVEALLTKADFSPNDTMLDDDENRTMLITGPNMAGKSTYMRQVAIIALMAHMGCFVPAKSAEISIIDKVFTRVGASDDLAFGQSTFMVEMSEVSNIINNATDKSLIILDEVGRGTSTYDGMSIASAIIEYLSSHLKAKTLFSTHYHELTDLEGRVDGVKNYRVMVKEWNGSVVFLHKIARGSANQSFGIEVAKLAGLPDELILRAKQILSEREKHENVATNGADRKIDTNANVSEVINVLKEMDMDNISPLMAFGTLQNLVDKVKK